MQRTAEKAQAPLVVALFVAAVVLIAWYRRSLPPGADVMPLRPNSQLFNQHKKSKITPPKGPKLRTCMQNEGRICTKREVQSPFVNWTMVDLSAGLEYPNFALAERVSLHPKLAEWPWVFDTPYVTSSEGGLFLFSRMQFDGPKPANSLCMSASSLLSVRSCPIEIEHLRVTYAVYVQLDDNMRLASRVEILPSHLQYSMWRAVHQFHQEKLRRSELGMPGAFPFNW